MTAVGSLGYEDNFGKAIADSTTSEGDIASHYPYNPERWRFYDGIDNSESNRVFLQYGSSGKYAHQRLDGNGAPDVHKLTPGSLDNLIFETAERFRYVVQYVSQASVAISTNQDLKDGDSVQIGPFDGTDGYGLEARFNSSTGLVYEFFIMRGGSKVETKDVTAEVNGSLTDFLRYSFRYNWYNVGNCELRQTSTSGGVQNNDTVARISRDGPRGPETGNLPIRCEVSTGSSTTGLEVNVGSVSWVTMGDVDGIVRTKTDEFKTAAVSNTGTWEPVGAIRIDPDREITNVQVTQLDINEFTGSSDVQLMAQACSPSKTDASGFSTPSAHNATNSVIEKTTSVSQFPDSTGSQSSTATNPGGIQNGYAALYTSSTGSNSRQNLVSRQKKRPILQSDEIVFIANAASATGDITFTYTVEQDW